MKKGYITAIAVAIMSFVLAITMGLYLIINNLHKEDKYVLYVGVQVDNTARKEKVKLLCETYVGDYTFIMGSGGYLLEDGAFLGETTYVCLLNYTNQETVEALAKKILQEVNGSSVLMEKYECDSIHSSSGYFD